MQALPEIVFRSLPTIRGRIAAHGDVPGNGVGFGVRGGALHVDIAAGVFGFDARAGPLM